MGYPELENLYRQIQSVRPEKRTKSAVALSQEIHQLLGLQVRQLAPLIRTRDDDLSLYIKITTGGGPTTQPVCSYQNCPNL